LSSLSSQSSTKLASNGDRIFVVGLALTVVFLTWEAILWPSGGGKPTCYDCAILDDGGFVVGLAVLIVGIAVSLLARKRTQTQYAEEDHP
jgi:hypothetical protein